MRERKTRGPANGERHRCSATPERMAELQDRWEKASAAIYAANLSPSLTPYSQVRPVLEAAGIPDEFWWDLDERRLGRRKP